MDDDRSKSRFGIFGIVALVLGIASVFAAGPAGIGVAFVAVIAGIVGNRRKERFSLAGVIIAGIVLIFLNLQGMGIIPIPAKNADLMRHYSDAIRSSTEIFKAAKEGHSAATAEKKELAKEKILKAIEKSLHAAQKVEAKRFDPYIPDFSKHFQNEFVQGLNLLQSGYTNGDKLKKIKGAALMDKWGRWNHDHREELVNLWHRWRPQPSLFRTIVGH